MLRLWTSLAARFGGLLLAILLVDPSDARAQSAGSEPAPATDERARFEALVERAVRHYREGAYERAAREFEAAFAIDPQPELIYNQARSLEKALRTKEAIAAYERFAALPGTTAEVRARALESMDALRREERVRERIASDRAAVQSTASEPDPANAAPSPSQRLSTSPEVRPPDRTLEWVLLGTGAALVAGGGVLGVLALDKSDQIDGAVAAQTPLSEVEALQDEANRNAAIADGLFIAGAVAGVTGLVLFWVRGDEAVSEVSVTPFAAEAGGGVVLGGPF